MKREIAAACAGWNTEALVARCLRHGASVNQRGAVDATPLHDTAAHSNVPIAQMLIESRTPVVPVHSVRERDRRLVPGFWRVSVRCGAPLTFPSGFSYLDATQAIAAAVRKW